MSEKAILIGLITPKLTQDQVDEYLEEYNDPTNRNPPMSLVFFQNAVDHISRISRILRQPRGNAMLIGQGGSGKQSTTRLGCIIAGAQFTQIELTAQFGMSEFLRKSNSAGKVCELTLS